MMQQGRMEEEEEEEEERLKEAMLLCLLKSLPIEQNDCVDFKVKVWHCWSRQVNNQNQTPADIDSNISTEASVNQKLNTQLETIVVDSYSDSSSKLSYFEMASSSTKVNFDLGLSHEGESSDKAHEHQLLFLKLQFVNELGAKIYKEGMERNCVKVEDHRGDMRDMVPVIYIGDRYFDDQGFMYIVVMNPRIIEKWGMTGTKEKVHIEPEEAPPILNKSNIKLQRVNDMTRVNTDNIFLGLYKYDGGEHMTYYRCEEPLLRELSDEKKLYVFTYEKDAKSEFIMTDNKYGHSYVNVDPKELAGYAYFGGPLPNYYFTAPKPKPFLNTPNQWDTLYSVTQDLYSQRVQKPPRYTEPLLQMVVVMALCVAEKRPIRCDYGKFILESLIEANLKNSSKNKLYMSAGPMLTRIAYQALGMIDDLPAAGPHASLIQHARFVPKSVKKMKVASSSRSTRSSKKDSTDDERTNTDKEKDLDESNKEDIQKGAEAKGPSEHEKSDEEDTSTPLDKNSKKPRTVDQHEAKVKELEQELAQAKAELELQKQQHEALNKGKEVVGSLASTSQISQAEIHLHVQLPSMTEILDLPSIHEEEQQGPAPGALDVREELEQEIEDMPEGPTKEFLLYKKKVMESVALAFLQPDEQQGRMEEEEEEEEERLKEAMLLCLLKSLLVEQNDCVDFNVKVWHCWSTYFDGLNWSLIKLSKHAGKDSTKLEG
ncbi:hypothetical protein L7F22_040653 [Adiantum nelumboides]|nr:hypothetical protein [Adiantum nelumboides]